MDRRTYLSWAGAVSLGTLTSGCSTLDDDPEPTQTATERPTPETESTRTPDSESTPNYEERFDTIVDLGETNIDATGTRPVTNVLKGHAADDTLLKFPPGRYLLDGWVFENRSNFGMTGYDATLVPPKNADKYWLVGGSLRNFLFEGFTIDNTAKNTGAGCMIRCRGGTNVVRDIAIRGQQDIEHTYGFSVMSAGKDTELRLENLDLTDGGVKATSIFAFPQKNFPNPNAEPGTLVLKNCRVAGWNGGVYLSPHGGPLRVLGGEYANNGVHQIRVGGGDGRARAIVRGVTVRVDDPPRHLTGVQRNMRGIWAEEGDRLLVEDCDVRVSNLAGVYSEGAIAIGQDYGRATVRNTKITVDADAVAVRAKPPSDQYKPDATPSMDALPAAWNLTLEDVTVRGQANASTAIHVTDRPNCAFNRVRLRQSGDGRDGLSLYGASSATITGGTWVVSRYPMLVQLSASGDSCPARLTDIERLESTGDVSGVKRLTNVVTASSLADGDRAAYCLDGGNSLAGDRLVAVTALQSDGLYGQVLPVAAVKN